MDIKEIREALRRQPFQPFTLALADGRKFPISHPDFVAVGKRRVIVIDPQDDSASFLEPLLIISIEIPNGTFPAGNVQES